MIINCIDRFWKKDSDSLLEKLCVDKEIFAVARLFVIKILRLDEVFFSPYLLFVGSVEQGNLFFPSPIFMTFVFDGTLIFLVA